MPQEASMYPCQQCQWSLAQCPTVKEEPELETPCEYAFFTHHHFDMIIIDEEDSLPSCNTCNMVVPLSSLNHTVTPCLSMMQHWTERKCKCLQDIHNVTYLQSQDTSFLVDSSELDAFDSFCCLGGGAIAADWLAVTYNLKKAQSCWAQVSRVLTKQHISAKTAGYFYKAVVQSVLLYGCETWFLSQQSIVTLEGFHNQVAHMLPQQTIYPDPITGSWVYLPAETAHSTSGLFTIQRNSSHNRAYILNWIQNCPLCNE
jgi:hypothetical protein